MRPTLKELYDSHDGRTTDKWTQYLSAHDHVLSSYRDKKICLIEIGVQNGGSLEIWSKYFPHALKIVGIDVNPEVGKLTFEDERIEVHVGDASAPETIALVCNTIETVDIIIDDGSHRSGDIIRAFSGFFPELSHGGIYLIEDLHCVYRRDFEGGLHHPYSAMAFLKALVDTMNHEHWENDLPSMERVQGILDHHHAVLPAASLKEFLSISFGNSTAAVYKALPHLCELGPRVVAGDLADVDETPKSLRGSYNATPVTHNAWSKYGSDPGQQLAEKDATPVDLVERGLCPDSSVRKRR